MVTSRSKVAELFCGAYVAVFQRYFAAMAALSTDNPSEAESPILRHKEGGFKPLLLDNSTISTKYEVRDPAGTALPRFDCKPAFKSRISAHNAVERAFTLVELLVVMAIITILASLLLPTLSKGREQARSVVCKNNLQQTGVALAMYVEDNRHYPLLVSTNNSASAIFTPGTSVEMWADKLKPYAKFSWTNRALHCPTYLAHGGAVGAVPTHGTMTNLLKTFDLSSYAYNYFGTGGYRGQTNYQLGLGAGAKETASESAIQAPSAMYAVADSRPVVRLMRTKMDITAGKSGYPQMYLYALNPTESPPPHGEGKCYNMLFVDGHTSPVKRSDYLYPPRSASHWNRDNMPHPETWAPSNQWSVRQ